MTDNHGSIPEVVWQDRCPWLILLRTPRIAISARVLLFAAAAVVTVTAGWHVIGLSFSGTSDELVQGWRDQYGTWPWTTVAPDLEDAPVDTADDDDPAGKVAGHDASRWTVEEVLQGEARVGRWLVIEPVSSVWQSMSNPFVQLFRSDLTVVGLAYLLLCCLWAVVVWALFAGAITRIAALALAREETLGPRAAIVHAAGKWHHYALAPLLPLLGILLVAGPLLVMGLLMRIPAVGGIFVLVGALLWPVALLIALLLAVMVFGLLAGWPLLWPAVSVERSDAFDAISNCYAYVYQRPLHYVFYVFVAAVLGFAGAVVVSLFVGGVDYLSTWAVTWGSAELERTIDNSALITFWRSCVFTLQVAFYYGFFWTAATAIYLLLRRDVDAKEMDEVVLQEQDEAPRPSAAQRSCRRRCSLPVPCGPRP